MAEKELKRLSRRELLEMLLEQGKENELLKAKLQEAENKLNDRKIMIEKSGSIAEASLQLNGVFKSIEEAGRQYLDNIERLSGEQEKICAEREAQSLEEAERLISRTQQKCLKLEEDTNLKCEKMEEVTRLKCEEMVKTAREKSAACWGEVSVKLDRFLEMNQDIREMIGVIKEENEAAN